MRWHQAKGTRVDDPKVEAFLKDLDDVCVKHGLSISHEDIHGGFVVEAYNKELASWLNEAAIGSSVKNG